MDKRIFVEKKPQFRVEAESLKTELNESLSLNIHNLRYVQVYDLFGFTTELLEKCRYTVFGEIVTDVVSDEMPLHGARHIAVEYLPGQFDQRASSAIDCVHLIDPNAEIDIRSSRLLIFDNGVSDEDILTIKHYYINTVEAREKNLSVLSNQLDVDVRPSVNLDGFTQMSHEEMEQFCRAWGLAMNVDDLNEVVKYFANEHRNPTETEIRILDTYWSDHCRHTTFTSEIQEITIDEGFMKSEMQESLQLYYRIRKSLGREDKSMCLMDLATIGARYLKKTGVLDDLEESEENNACSIYVDVDVDGKTEKWILQFKNETHNHPTEIEPFGGASTCLGGAIRDPLSGRAYVYQAMRVTGAGDITLPVSATLSGKLPQKVISRKAAHGYSSYGNQIGLATTHVREIYHDDFVAKRLEVGAVVGAVKTENVRRESPQEGDVILLLGGRTGRDGIGGATGSSKTHKEASLETCGSEVQKGNAPEERKLQHLFRRAEVTRLIKKSNDFGAGGVSVAIGELADGLDIYLDRVRTKYLGLTPTEIAISESQERMAVVISIDDKEEFMRYCHEENVEVTHVADVKDSGRMRLFYKDDVVADISREFINSAGAKHYAKARIAAVEEVNPMHQDAGVMKSLNVKSQKNLVEMFDSTIGRSTVLMPYGGKYQLTPTQVSVQKLPVDGYTDTASVMAYGYDATISKWSPYHGAAYAIIDACTKVVACGAEWQKMRFSYQEYFERMTDDAHSWGKPLSALLGALKMQVELGLPSIGGKDSMSGTFEHINVPPTLITFGVTTVNVSHVISPEFKYAGNKLYLICHTPQDNYMPNIEGLKRNWAFVTSGIRSGKIVSAYALSCGGLTEALEKCKAGNHAEYLLYDTSLPMYDLSYGSILVEASEELQYDDATAIGEIVSVAKTSMAGGQEQEEKPLILNHRPSVYLPVFPGTNCDYDTAKAFRRAGADTFSSVFRNLTGCDVLDSIVEMQKNIDKADVLVFSGGFSSGDEPDGSGKFIANVINNKDVASAIERLLARGGLILGICNGFQALIKSGLLPYGKVGAVKEDSPTLFRNDVNRHVSQMVSTCVATVNSPWLTSFHVGDVHQIAVSHGEGKFMVSEEEASRLLANGQVAFQYVDVDTLQPTQQFPYNPNGSCHAIEGIISPDGHILGKMGHSERWENGLFRNINGDCNQDIFRNAVEYFNKMTK
ncbi:MAG: phosphoribosylformylglycinamidine synthase [Prevotella sp.]|nr:phosphoribosylformylglycinamidine synthase [Candidatus Equicola faecalis]